MNIQGGTAEIRTPTQWALIARISTAMPPVLSPSSILPPHSRKENFGARYNNFLYLFFFFYFFKIACVRNCLT
jgi:hypothetical protein